MPGLDRTGPQGIGPRTGGGFGLCGGDELPPRGRGWGWGRSWRASPSAPDERITGPWRRGPVDLEERVADRAERLRRQADRLEERALRMRARADGMDGAASDA
jgi:hypothetical protein